MLELGLNGASHVLVVILAFSALVFVHELGHYLAARFVGIRVERFFIGFDAWGIGLKKEINGCIYGIGILPLGGYVKIAGQADDPREEKITGAPDELRSKPLWAQALVMVSGVGMNFIFGYILLVCGFLYGIPFIPNVLGELTPNGPAAVHGLKTGDRVLSINGEKTETFIGVQQIIAESPGAELLFKVEREKKDGTKEVFDRRIRGLRNENIRGNMPTIGAMTPMGRTVKAVTDHPDFEQLSDSVKPGDRVVAINGVPIEKYHGHLIQKMVENLPGKDVELMLERDSVEGGEPDNITVKVPTEAYGEYDFGLRFKIQCVGIQPGSPAEEAGIRPGALVCYVKKGDEKVYFRETTDFIDAVKECAWNDVSLLVRRGDSEIEVKVKPRPMPGDVRFETRDDTFLGILVDPETKDSIKVKDVFADGPSADGLVAGDVILKIGDKEVDPAGSLGKQVEQASSKDVSLMVQSKVGSPMSEVSLRPRYSWQHRKPMIGVTLMRGPISHFVEGAYAGKALSDDIIGSTMLAFFLSRDLKTTTITFARPDGEIVTKMVDTPKSVLDDPLAAGLKARLALDLKPVRVSVRQGSLVAAMGRAGEEWLGMSMMIYRVIYKLFSRKISVEAMGGPVLLFRSIKNATDVSFGYLLYWIALISINLGVCNLLPFPVLDGGHLVFLGIEWLKGSPPSMRVREIAQYIGIVCLLALMLTVTGFDIFYLIKGS